MHAKLLREVFGRNYRLQDIQLVTEIVL